MIVALLLILFFVVITLSNSESFHDTKVRDIDVPISSLDFLNNPLNKKTQSCDYSTFYNEYTNCGNIIPIHKIIKQLVIAGLVTTDMNDSECKNNGENNYIKSISGVDLNRYIKISELSDELKEHLRKLYVSVWPDVCHNR